MEFAAAAWSTPLTIRIFHISPSLAATEHTFRSNAWSDTSSAMPPEADPLSPGQPVAASRSADGSGRYLEYFYAAADGRIKYVASNREGEPVFQNLIGEYEAPVGREGMKVGEVVGIAISCVAVVVGTVVAVLVWWFRPEQVRAWCMCARRRRRRVGGPRYKEITMGDASSG